MSCLGLHRALVPLSFMSQCRKEFSKSEVIIRMDACVVYKWVEKGASPRELSGLQFHNQRKSGQGEELGLS